MGLLVSWAALWLLFPAIGTWNWLEFEGFTTTGGLHDVSIVDRTKFSQLDKITE